MSKGGRKAEWGGWEGKYDYKRGLPSRCAKPHSGFSSPPAGNQHSFKREGSPPAPPLGPLSSFSPGCLPPLVKLPPSLLLQVYLSFPFHAPPFPSLCLTHTPMSSALELDTPERVGNFSNQEVEAGGSVILKYVAHLGHTKTLSQKGGGMKKWLCG